MDLLISHLGVFAFSVVLQFAQVWYVESIKNDFVVRVGIANIIAAAAGIGPAIWVARQEEMIITLFLCLVFGQGAGAYLKRVQTTKVWIREGELRISNK